MTSRELKPNGAWNQLLAFILNGQAYALRLDSVERLVRMVEVTPLPGAPEIVMGLINLQGRIMPVLNMKKRFGLPESQPDWNDYLIIAHTSTRNVSLVADGVIGVIERDGREITPVESIVPSVEHIAGVVKLEDGVLFIHDLDRFLSWDEEVHLDAVMAKN